MNLETSIQIISIIGFFAGAIMFFVKTGEYKTNIQKDIETLKGEVKENDNEIKDLHKEIEKLRNESNQNTTRFETLLIEVKTKIDIIMQTSEIFKNNNNNE